MHSVENCFGSLRQVETIDDLIGLSQTDLLLCNQLVKLVPATTRVEQLLIQSEVEDARTGGLPSESVIMCHTPAEPRSNQINHAGRQRKLPHVGM